MKRSPSEPAEADDQHQSPAMSETAAPHPAPAAQTAGATEIPGFSRRTAQLSPNHSGLCLKPLALDFHYTAINNMYLKLLKIHHLVGHPREQFGPDIFFFKDKGFHIISVPTFLSLCFLFWKIGGTSTFCLEWGLGGTLVGHNSALGIDLHGYPELAKSPGTQSPRRPHL